MIPFHIALIIGLITSILTLFPPCWLLMIVLLIGRLVYDSFKTLDDPFGFVNRMYNKIVGPNGFMMKFAETAKSVFTTISDFASDMITMGANMFEDVGLFLEESVVGFVDGAVDFIENGLDSIGTYLQIGYEGDDPNLVNDVMDIATDGFKTIKNFFGEQFNNLKTIAVNTFNTLINSCVSIFNDFIEGAKDLFITIGQGLSDMFEFLVITIPKKIGCAVGIDSLCEEQEERYTELQYKYETRENFVIALVMKEMGLLDGIKFEFSAKNILQDIPLTILNNVGELMFDLVFNKLL